MKTKWILLCLSSTLLLAGCASEKVKVLKSPCVGLEGSPCGPKRVPAGNIGHAATVEQA